MEKDEANVEAPELSETPKTPKSRALSKFIMASIWALSLGTIVGAPLLAWYYYESQSTTQELTDCEVTETNPLRIDGVRGSSRVYLAIRSSCGDFRLDSEYVTQVFPGDSIDLTAKVYPGSAAYATPSAITRAD